MPMLPIFEFLKIWYGMRCKEAWDATMAFANGALSKEIAWKDCGETHAKFYVWDFFGLWMHQYTCYTSHSLMHDPKFNVWHALSIEGSFFDLVPFMLFPWCHNWSWVFFGQGSKVHAFPTIPIRHFLFVPLNKDNFIPLMFLNCSRSLCKWL